MGGWLAKHVEDRWPWSRLRSLSSPTALIMAMSTPGEVLPHPRYPRLSRNAPVAGVAYEFRRALYTLQRPTCLLLIEGCAHQSVTLLKGADYHARSGW